MLRDTTFLGLIPRRAPGGPVAEAGCRVAGGCTLLWMCPLIPARGAQVERRFWVCFDRRHHHGRRHAAVLHGRHLRHLLRLLAHLRPHCVDVSVLQRQHCAVAPPGDDHPGNLRIDTSAAWRPAAFTARSRSAARRRLLGHTLRRSRHGCGSSARDVSSALHLGASSGSSVGEQPRLHFAGDAPARPRTQDTGSRCMTPPPPTPRPSPRP